MIIRKVFRQSSVYFLASLFSVVIGFFFKMYISNVFGAELLGVFALGMTAVGLVSVFAGLGYDSSLVRFVSKYVAEKKWGSLERLVSSTIILVLIVSTLICLGFYFFAEPISTLFFDEPKLSLYLPFFGVFVIISCLGTVADQIIRGLQEVKKSAVITNFYRLPLKIFLCLLFIFYGFGLKGYVWAEIISFFVSLVMMLLLIKQLAKNWSVFSFQKINFDKKERAYAFNMFIINVVSLLQRHGDKILLVLFLSTTDLGIYYVILSVSVFIPVVLSAVNSIFAPIISELYSQKKLVELASAFRKMGRYVFVFTFPFVIFLLLFNHQILSYFGPEFSTATVLFNLVVIGELCSISFGSVGMMLNMMGYEKKMRNISIFTSLLSFVLYYFLISAFGMFGLGLSYLTHRFLINFLATRTLFKKTSICLLNRTHLRVVSSFVALGILIVFLFLPSHTYSVAALVFFLVAIYSVFLLAWRYVIGKRDAEILLQELKLIIK